MDNYLFRGLNLKESERGRLIPRSNVNLYIMVYHPDILINGSLNFNSSKVEAIRHQQSHPTAGVSTSKLFNVAAKYATRNGTKDGVVAKILRSKLFIHRIKEFDTELFGIQEKQADQELILYSGSGGSYFPEEIVIELIKVAKSNYLSSRGSTQCPNPRWDSAIRKK